ncbi:alcohol dehydrogenase catalytic domain-containing protein, partial [Micrococcus sp. HSID17245]|uniref:alcohol dehydrogenase catalytic domain-containing protein n=1 Tax=Micrococcus sp. HSID17245 TaxID=2419508 RepID=UPI001EE8009F
MRALVLQSYGGREAMALTDVPAPTVGAGEVLIRTRAVGLNPVDAMHREGDFKAIAPDDFPTVAGNELSGIVETVGAGVTAFAPGDAVITRVDPSGHGAFAELAAVRADWVAAAPARMPLTDAPGLPPAGLTARQALGPAVLALRPGASLPRPAGARLLRSGAPRPGHLP